MYFKYSDVPSPFFVYTQKEGSRFLWLGGFVAQIVARDSRCESILVAGRDEQAAADAIPHDELVLLQFGAEDARFTDGVV